ncbi:MAG: hypothetical protein PHN24_08870 [Eubacteriales bacterium]|nr:hypothetical protein [Eubacteriales bacterium]
MDDKDVKEKGKGGSVWLRVAVIAVAAALIVGGIFIFQDNSEPQALAGRGEGILEAAQQQSSLMKGAVFTQTVRYDKCGHEVVIRLSDTDKYAGMNHERLAEEFPDWQITSFMPLNVAMEMEMPVFCAEHTVLMSRNGEAGIYRNESGNEMKLVSPLDIELSALGEDKQRELISGMAFSSLGELEAYLENLES